MSALDAVFSVKSNDVSLGVFLGENKQDSGATSEWKGIFLQNGDALVSSAYPEFQRHKVSWNVETASHNFPKSGNVTKPSNWPQTRFNTSQTNKFNISSSLWFGLVLNLNVFSQINCSSNNIFVSKSSFKLKLTKKRFCKPTVFSQSYDKIFPN